MSWSDVRRTAGLAVTALVMGTALNAAPLVGSFGFVGDGVAVFKTGSENFIDFRLPVAGGFGNFDVTSVSGGSTFPYLGTDVGTIKDTSDTNPPTAPYTYFPVGVNTSINNYINITGYNHNFIAELLEAQTCPYVPGTILCAGPFTLSKVGSNVSISASVRGRIINNDTLEESFFVLSLNGTLNNTTVENVAAAAQTANGVSLDNWSGTLTADAVPEPGTWTMILSGVGLLGFGLRRRK